MTESIASAAAAWPSTKRWPYVSAVIAMPLCPSRSETRFMSTPRAIRIEAELWRRSVSYTHLIQLLRVVLIYTSYVTAELRSAVSIGSTRVLAQTNIHALKCPIDLSKNDRR